MERKSQSNDAQQEMLLTGQCPNCSHSTAILYSAPQTLRNTIEHVQDEREIMYSATPKKQRPALSSVNVSIIGVIWDGCGVSLLLFIALFFCSLHLKILTLSCTSLYPDV